MIGGRRGGVVMDEGRIGGNVMGGERRQNMRRWWGVAQGTLLFLVKRLCCFGSVL